MAYVGEIRIFAGNFAPTGWAFCDGSTLQMADYPNLSLYLGNYFGGDGRTTFNLPDMRGRVPIERGQGPGLSANYPGLQGGAETVKLAPENTAPHTHVAYGSNSANSLDPTGNVWADNPSIVQFSSQVANTATMGSSLLPDAGGGAAHENMLPFTVLNFIIALDGSSPQPTDPA